MSAKILVYAIALHIYIAGGEHAPPEPHWKVDEMIKFWLEEHDDDATLVEKVHHILVTERRWLKRLLSFKKPRHFSIKPYRHDENADHDKEQCLVLIPSDEDVDSDAAAYIRKWKCFCQKLFNRLNNFPPADRKGKGEKSLIDFALALDVPSLENVTNPSFEEQQPKRRPQFLLYLTENWSKERMKWFAFIWLFLSLGISVGYAILTKDNATAFTIGSYFLTWGSSLVATLGIAVSV
ncbi:hypothetical protein RUND412_011431, partial [Rhizina undulata]